MNSKSDTMDAEIDELVRQINFLLTGRYVSVNTTPIKKEIKALLLRERIESEYKGKRKMLRRMVVKGYLEDTKAVAWLTVIEAERNKELSRLSEEESHE